MPDPSLDRQLRMYFQPFLEPPEQREYNELEEVELVEDEDEEDEEDDDDDDDDDEEYIPAAPEPSPRVSQDGPSTSNRVIVLDEEPEDCVDEDFNKRRRIEGGDACLSLGIGAAESSQENECNRSDVDGLVCPICMDTWTDDGEHHICCLPCGHIYGMSCIKRWLQQRKSPKCPQCNRKCTIKDVRKLYASRVVAVDEESHKKIQSLEAKCASLERKGADWHKKEAGWQKREAELNLKVQELTERNTHLERLLEDMLSRQSVLVNGNWDCQWNLKSEHDVGTKAYGKGSCCTFELQKAVQLDGARVFDINASTQISLIARKPKGIGGPYLLTKLSLMSPNDMEDILLPSTTNAIRDLHFSPTNGSLAIYATIGKKLSVLSMESNNVVVSYDLQVPAWSCSWDLNRSHFIYAGLQNGSVLVFDMRQTAGPVNSLNGLSCNPVHTIESIKQDSYLSSGVSTILTASAIGLCQWSIGAEEGPYLIPETDNQGVCVSLAYCPTSDDIVLSYRPKFDMPTDVPLSQLPLTSQVTGQGVLGSNVLLRRVGGNHFQKLGSSCANLSNIRLPKCVIVDTGNENGCFAFEDEVNHELVLQELPSFRDLQRFKSPDHVRDVRYSNNASHGLLGCLSENWMMLFGSKLS